MGPALEHRQRVRRSVDLRVQLTICEDSLAQVCGAFAGAMVGSASLGLAFVISAHNSISMFIGGVIALCPSKRYPSWSKRFLVAICAGLTVGQGLTDVGVALRYILMG